MDSDDFPRLAGTPASSCTSRSSPVKGAWNSEEEFEKATREWSRFRFYTTRVVRGVHFDYFSGFVVILNAIVMGLQTDYQARVVTDRTTTAFRVFEVLFCVLFTVELLLRLYVWRGAFFKGQDLKWNLFDLFLVTTQLTEEIITVVVDLAIVGQSESEGGDDDGASNATSNFSVLRVLRILRLIRVLRLMRVLRLIGELRTLVMSVLFSLKALVWAVLLLLVLIYVLGVYITQLVLDHRIGLKDQLDYDPMLVYYFGSLGDSIHHLYQAVTGGVDWGDLVVPLREDISVWLVPFFMFYIAFALLCMMNVITGVFVESALLTAKKDKDVYMVNHVRTVFKRVNTENNGELSWEEFRDALEMPDMKEVFEQIDIDISEANRLFHLLDMDDNGRIEAEEFIAGCSRLRGPAKALDLTMLMKENGLFTNDFYRHARSMEQTLTWMSELLTNLYQQRSMRTDSIRADSGDVSSVYASVRDVRETVSDWGEC